MLTLLLAVMLAQQSAPDNHLALCHGDFLHFYRVQIEERTPNGTVAAKWSRWYLIDDRQPEDKQEIKETLDFYRKNHIKVEYKTVEGKLPD